MNPLLHLIPAHIRYLKNIQWNGRDLQDLIAAGAPLEPWAAVCSTSKPPEGAVKNTLRADFHLEGFRLIDIINEGYGDSFYPQAILVDDYGLVKTWPINQVKFPSLSTLPTPFT